MIHTQDADFTLYQGDVMDELAGLPDESVHCVVTSPPYWGLRDYSVDGQLGLEPTPEQYVARMVEVFREVRRVLRADGTCWVNLGDSYAGGGGYAPDAPVNVARREQGSGMDGKFKFSPRVHDRQTVKPKIETGLKQKDLVGIPWRVAFALQADGWWLRSDIIWAKPNPMPESVTDRPTKAHEYVFLLTKSAKYFFDQEAVREAHVEPWRSTGKPERGGLIGNVNGMKHTFDRREYNPAARNVRSVWDIPTQPYAEAHFATYPEELVRRCVLAGSSERGCCPVCGKPWERETEITLAATTRTSPPNKGRVGDFLGEKAAALTASGWVPNREKTVTTLGWRPGCDCPCSFDCAECRFEEHVPSPIPCTILDPFLGSGTTAFVARKHGRRSIGVELNESYANLAAKRMAQQSLFA